MQPGDGNFVPDVLRDAQIFAVQPRDVVRGERVRGKAADEPHSSTSLVVVLK